MSQEIVSPQNAAATARGGAPRGEAGAAPAGEPEALRREVSRLLGRDLGPADDEANLFELGLQSLQLMRLTNRLNRAGAKVDFRELSADPRLTAWCALLNGAGGETAEPEHAPVRENPVTRPVAEGEPFALTSVQQAYWIGRGDDQPLGGVGCHAYLEIDAADVDPGRLEGAVRALMELHPMLRARFEADATQRVLPRSPWPGLTVHDFSGHSAGAATRALEDLRGRLSHRRLDVAAGEVLDVQLSLSPDEGAGTRARLHLNVDLLVADVHSIRLLLADLAALYEDPASVPEVTCTFAQYLADRSAARASEREAARAYWQGRIPELPGGPRLPLAVDPADVRETRFARRTHELSPEEWSTLQGRAAAVGVTPSVLVATAFAEVLARWSGTDRFLLNLPLFDRDMDADPQIGRIVADFTSLVLLEVDLGLGGSFAERALAVQKQLHQDVGHAAYTGVEVLRDLVRADAEAPRAAPVVFACNLDAPLVPDACAERFGELSWMVSQTPQVWLDHQVYRTRSGGLLLAWDAVEELFPDGVLDAMFSAYAALLGELAAGGGQDGVGPALPESQRCRRAEVNSATREESGRLLHTAFFARAAERAGHPALLWEDGARLTHAELADQALRIGAALVRRGIGRGSSVVVTAPKGPGQIAAVLGVLAAGAAYVPVGVDQPAARRARILELSGARLVLDGTGADPVSRETSAAGDHEVLALAEALREEPLERPAHAEPGDPAYTIFTSGSTGTPKGVELSHRAAVNTVEDVNERFGVGHADRVLAVSALDFDLSVWDIFGPLAEGGALVLIDEAERQDAQRWLALCARHGVTVWNSVPALMDMLLTAADGDPLPPSLRLALLSGDWIGLDLPERLREASGGRCRLVGLGGATEAAIWSNAYEIDGVPEGWRSIPYGTPLRNQRFRVVDCRGRDCPDWVPGELWIGGTGVALGYRGDPGLSAERFPEVAGERWYRTGDLGRYRPDGNLEFLGRLDHQVKLNGFRVELGEIEAGLQSHPGVSAAVAVTVGEHRRELVAAVVERPAAQQAEAGYEISREARDEGPERDGDLLELHLVETLLAELLAPAVEGPDGARALPVCDEQRLVLDAWWAHLERHEVVRREGADVRPGRRWPEARHPERAEALRALARGTHLEPVATALAHAGPVLAAVLSGAAHASVLLDDPVLSPEGLADASPGTHACLGRIADALRGSAEEGAGAVAEWDGGSGLGAARLLSGLAPGSLDYTLFSPSGTLLATADTRLSETGHRVRGVRQGTTGVLAEHLHAYDAVLANNALHRMPTPQAAVATMALLLKPGGRLHFVERERLSPLALLIALPLEAQAGRMRPGGPWLLTGPEWVRECAAAGLTDVRVVRTEDTGEVLVTARRPYDAEGLDAEELRGWAEERLPAHMVPAGIVALPALPLSANGKVDRAGVRGVLASLAGGRREEAEPPRGALEETVAGMWTELLGLPSVGREENFFSLGGDSLLATRLVTRVHAELGVELPMRDVMRAPTVAGLSALIGGLRSADRDGSAGAGAADAEFEEGVL
ncbi:amino acid adenylation domain-containing protein [Streptomyces sp. ODS28]|uniref:amino acid adenylation domain-containing protein n=1 Tax=Streptomyces sp. ODS28 TaxID=3136688 RepID=UPI0031E89407